LQPWRALDHDQGLAWARACRGGRDPDADRRNDRAGAGHRAHRADELSSHLRSISRSRVAGWPAYGPRGGRELEKRWLGSTGAPARPGGWCCWARRAGGFLRGRVTATEGFPDTGPG